LKIEKNKILLGDCMDLMAEMPDNYIDLAIVDPEYGIELQGPCGHSQKWGGVQKINKNPPDKKYFVELFRTSKNYIIWGANYFYIKGHRQCIIWDKGPSMSRRSFSECEIAETSFNDVSRIKKIHPVIKNKIHPTQKPVALYRWLLQNYAKPGQLILDTHSGSGSCAIACMLEGFDFIAIEKDKDYWKASVDRFNTEKSQLKLF
jgi:site-specific DNA-methyltransferase (adenine-specific)